MRTVKRWLLPGGIIVGALAVTATLIAARPEAPKRDETPPQPLVEVEPAQELAGEFLLSAQGTVMPRTQTTLVSEVGGTVLEVSPAFAAGGFFRQGEVLLKIDPKDYAAALKRAEATLANRRALLAQESARADQALKDWQNLRRPGEPSDLVLRKPYVAEAEANLRSAEADLEQAQINLDRTVIRAPFDGLLREKQADRGQYVGTGTPLATLYAVDVAEVRLPLTEQDVAFVTLPAPGATGETVVTLVATVGGERRTWPARLVRSEAVLDEKSRVLYAVAEIVDPYGLNSDGQQSPLTFGTFVRAEIPASIGHHVVGVPRHALRGSDQLLLVDGDSKLRLRDVHVVRSDAQLVYVDAGLNPGERVVLTTLDAPVEGMPVRIANAEPAAQADAEAVARKD